MLRNKNYGLLFVTFFPICYYFLLVTAIFLSTLLSKILSPYSSFNMGNQDSRSYKITGKIIEMHFSVFLFLRDGSREDDRLWKEW